MRIAQVSPLYESVPPRLYGGTERVVSYLTDELVRQGHEVTLFASGDSVTRANLVEGCPRALRLDRCVDPLAHHLLMLERVFRRSADFDIIHYHLDYLHYPFSRRQHGVHVTTLHGRLDLPDLAPLYREFSDIPTVSISDAQQDPLSWINWQATVYHGLPLDLYRLQESSFGYLAFLGRVSPEKRLDWAIEIAGRAGKEIRIAAKVDRADQEYFERVIEPLLHLPHVTFVGEIGEDAKQPFLGHADALIFPIDWPEPFGLVMIEAMACGTPVIALRRGSVPEILDDGITGYVCGHLDEAVAAAGRLAGFDRRACRREFERRFDVARMARDYVKVYQRLIENHAANGRATSRPGSILHTCHLPAS